MLDPKKTLVIVSPGNLDDMVNYPAACKAKKIDYVFDPGQSIPMLEGQDLIQAIEGCRILICNDYELNLIMGKTGLATGDLLDKAGDIIVTLGESGSQILKGDQVISIPAAKADKVVDPTGAGDAYRGGLITGLVQGKDVEPAALMGSVCASFAVECYGTQGYRFGPNEFDKRLGRCS